MPVHEISREHWSEFFERFSDQHKSWLASVELLAPTGGRVQATGLPLEDIELADDEQTGPEVRIHLGGDAPEEKSLADVTHVRIERTTHGADTTLSLESRAGTALILRFRSPMLPAEVDGMP